MTDQPTFTEAEDDPEDFSTCEGCNAKIKEGDKYHYCNDGVSLCEACAPMASDEIKQMTEALDKGEWENWYGDFYETEDELREARDRMAVEVAEKGDYKLLSGGSND